jgi:hypothetical protein
MESNHPASKISHQAYKVTDYFELFHELPAFKTCLQEQGLGDHVDLTALTPTPGAFSEAYRWNSVLLR